MRKLRTGSYFAAIAAAVLVGGVAQAGDAVAETLQKDAHKPTASDPAQCNTGLVKYSIGNTCFQSTGDYQWVRDTDQNGWTLVGQLQTSYGVDRFCSALPSTDDGGWCNWDVGEDGCVRYRVFETHAGVQRDYSNWSHWYHASNGTLC